MTGGAFAPRRNGAIALLLLLFVALGMVYSITTPLFETPDEPAHYRYVKWIADGKGLPPLLVSEDQWEQGEFHQPPLYYVAGALLTFHVDTGAAEDVCERNPYAALGAPHSSGNKNAVLHLEEDHFPYTGVSRAVHFLRWFGVLCAMGTVYLTYRIALEIFPQHRALAVGAAALAAFNPQFIFISAAANNDSLATLLATLVVYLCLDVSRGRGRRQMTPVALGIVLGLAVLSKLSGLALALLVPCAYWLYARRFGTGKLWEDFVRPILVVAGVSLLVAGWWYGRNALIYQDPLGMTSYHDIFSVHGDPLSLGQSLQVLLESFPSYWGVFGWMNIVADEGFYTFYRVLFALALTGLGLQIIRARRKGQRLLHERWEAVVILWVWTLILLGLLFQWSRTITRTQGRLMFPAISALSLFLFVGLSGWLPRRLVRWLAGGMMAGLFVVALSVPFRYIVPTYALPERIALEEVPQGLGSLDVHFGDELLLLSYALPQDGARAGEQLHLRLFWLARQRMCEDYTFYVHLLGRDGVRLGGVDTYPGGGLYPTRLWVPGEVVVEDYDIDVLSDAEGPGPGIVRVGVYQMPGFKQLPVLDGQGRQIDAGPEIARLRIAPAQVPHYQPQYPMQVNFGHKISLTGYDFSPASPVPGDIWEITLYWDALSRMEEDYTIFMHLLDQAGERVAQLDEPPLSGEYPTHLWGAQDLVKDAHLLVLPSELPAGKYQLRIGFYRLETGERLDVIGADPPANWVLLGPIHIGDRAVGD